MNIFDIGTTLVFQSNFGHWEFLILDDVKEICLSQYAGRLINLVTDKGNKYIEMIKGTHYRYLKTGDVITMFLPLLKSNDDGDLGGSHFIFAGCHIRRDHGHWIKCNKSFVQLLESGVRL